MSLVWTFIFVAVLVYLSTNLVLKIDHLDGWLKALYFIVLIPGYGLVTYQIRMHFQRKQQPETTN
ncbi:MAG: hypothetical protein H2B05_04430 [Nitrosopumilaceae archaeon]|uniref:Uncharacterized protein n=1 Tax=Candidatus Nitrosomaritimum aestuariumsis TaxID=3342354 RepID=A0AC60W368_9ARCH|nr:hypothetical protein [Nitrosopumilaceae archaeon]MBA4459781.1 hypothetical protein [Nitrosopumilaceae archaeon]MBA4462530.1 hypothetical protein [Nitrosopumilaceae archaeon]